VLYPDEATRPAHTPKPLGLEPAESPGLMVQGESSSGLLDSATSGSYEPEAVKCSQKLTELSGQTPALQSRQPKPPPPPKQANQDSAKRRSRPKTGSSSSSKQLAKKVARRSDNMSREEKRKRWKLLQQALSDTENTGALEKAGTNKLWEPKLWGGTKEGPSSAAPRGTLSEEALEVRNSRKRKHVTGRNLLENL
jgi:hypothetical protein